MDPNDSLNAIEVAQLLGITKNTVYELVKRGDIASYKIGKKLRIDKKDVEDYINNQKVSKNTKEYKTVNNPQENTNDIVITGQDFIVDILTDLINENMPHVRAYKSNIGSYTSLFDLYNDKISICTAHLWDGETNSYNIEFVRRLLPGVKCLVINLAYRKQGFYVKKGNPLNINNWNDLERDDVKMINREKGSGTRILLDEKLRINKIKASSINGYKDEKNSHLSVVSTISRGEADVGIGTAKFAMQVENVDFIPLQEEEYDIVIKEETMLSNPIFREILNIINSEDYKNQIKGLGGYDLRDLGKIKYRT